VLQNKLALCEVARINEYWSTRFFDLNVLPRGKNIRKDTTK
jgi:hypothetical protein